MDRPLAGHFVRLLLQRDGAFHGGLQTVVTPRAPAHRREGSPGAAPAPAACGRAPDFDGSAPRPKYLPEAAIHVVLGTGHRRGLMARIDVDEDGAAGVQSDRQLKWEATPGVCAGSAVEL